MKISSAMLAMGAQMQPNGLLDIVGVGLRYVEYSHFPSTVAGTLVAVLEMDETAAESAPILQMKVTNLDRHPWLSDTDHEIVVDTWVRDAHPLRGVFYMPFAGTVDGPTTIVFEVSAPGFGQLARVELPVVQAAS